jgi:hypothetical protein
MLGGLEGIRGGPGTILCELGTILGGLEKILGGLGTILGGLETILCGLETILCGLGTILGGLGTILGGRHSNVQLAARKESSPELVGGRHCGAAVPAGENP